jgi:chromosome partitioning protein
MYNIIIVNMEDCMAKVYACINQKGGVGKSTTVFNLAAALTKRKKKVLAVDLDSQRNLSKFAGIVDDDTAEGQGAYTVLDLLHGKAPISVAETPIGDFIRGNKTLNAADTMFVKTGKEFLLKKALAPLLEKYDYILLDTPPHLGILTVNALTATQRVVICALPDTASLDGFGDLLENIADIQEYTNPEIEIAGILFTRYKGNTKMSAAIRSLGESLAKSIDSKVYKSHIRETVQVSVAAGNKMDIISFAPKNNAAIDYMNFADEIIKEK